MIIGSDQKYWISFLLIPVFLFPSCLTQSNSPGERPPNEENFPQGMPRGPPPQPFPYALSSTYLIHLAKTEVEVYKEMKIYAKAIEKRIALIKAYLKDYEDSSVKGTSHLPKNADPEKKASVIAEHPILAYRLISRFATEFDVIGAHISQRLEETLGGKINKLAGVFPFPAKSDLQDAMEAILRVQYYYNLKSKQIAKGNMMGVKTNVELPPHLTYKLGDYSAHNEYYSLALDWYKATESIMKKNKDTVSVSPLKLARSNKWIMENHDKNFEKNKKDSHPYMFTKRLGGNPTGVTLRSVKYEEKGKNKSEPRSEHYRVLALCNGEYLQTPKYMTTLKCSYERPNPYFYLFPLKAEILSHDPLLIQYHDVISEQWFRDLKKAAMPTIQRFDPRIEDGTSRSAIYAYLDDEEIPTVPFARRMELITGLNVRGFNASQALQVASYTYGGHVSSHYDSIGSDHDPSIQTKGDRVAVLLAYMNTIEHGGLTAFPKFGTFVKPIKGSAVFWYTALKNGEPDKRTLHVACPLAAGHKWIATKRAHLFKNFLKRPCDLNPNI